jgi:hypothetical protein
MTLVAVAPTDQRFQILGGRDTQAGISPPKLDDFWAGCGGNAGLQALASRFDSSAVAVESRHRERSLRSTSKQAKIC